MADVAVMCGGPLTMDKLMPSVRLLVKDDSHYVRAALGSVHSRAWRCHETVFFVFFALTAWCVWA